MNRCSGRAGTLMIPQKRLYQPLGSAIRGCTWSQCYCVDIDNIPSLLLERRCAAKSLYPKMTSAVAYISCFIRPNLQNNIQTKRPENQWTLPEAIRIAGRKRKKKNEKKYAEMSRTHVCSKYTIINLWIIFWIAYVSLFFVCTLYCPTVGCRISSHFGKIIIIFQIQHWKYWTSLSYCFATCIYSCPFACQ